MNAFASKDGGSFASRMNALFSRDRALLSSSERFCEKTAHFSFAFAIYSLRLLKDLRLWSRNLFFCQTGRRPAGPPRPSLGQLSSSQHRESSRFSSSLEVADPGGRLRAESPLGFKRTPEPVNLKTGPCSSMNAFAPETIVGLLFPCERFCPEGSRVQIQTEPPSNPYRFCFQ